MKFGDPVIYTENGTDYVATVLATRELDHHAGADGQPLLQIGFFALPTINRGIPAPGATIAAAPDPDSVVRTVLGTSRQNDLVQFRADVAHQSHAFGPEAHADAATKRQILPTIFTGGRWREINEAPHALNPHELAQLANAKEEPQAEEVPAGIQAENAVIAGTPVNAPPAGNLGAQGSTEPGGEGGTGGNDKVN